jgi:myo-inositol 2-dehydrogenase/D-chiro-inositol 1-dehydrogenase
MGLGLPWRLCDGRRKSREKVEYCASHNHPADPSAFVHEIDICRWLLSAEFISATVIPCAGIGNSGIADPLLFILEMNNGTVVSAEVFVNASYGYHVQAEAVCSNGTVSLAQPALTHSKRGDAEMAGFPPNWIPRFADAYRVQGQAWVDALRLGKVSEDASTSWDGLVATCLAEQIVSALRTWQRTELRLPSRPV